jgi:hypothetical protein
VLHQEGMHFYPTSAQSSRQQQKINQIEMVKCGIAILNEVKMPLEIFLVRGGAKYLQEASIPVKSAEICPDLPKIDVIICPLFVLPP